MANWLTTVLTNGFLRWTERFESGEWRAPDIAAVKVAETEVTVPDIDTLRKDESRAVYADMPIRQAAGSGTARSHNFTGSKGDSQRTPISFSSFTEEGAISFKQNRNNTIPASEAFAKMQKDKVWSLLNRANAWFISSLKTAKTQYNVGGAKGSFDGDNKNYLIPYSEKNYFHAEIKTMMQRNLYVGPLVVINDVYANHEANKLRAQGSANATNYAWQFDGEMLSTNNTILGTDFDGSAIVFEKGLVGVINWIPVEYRQPLDPDKAMSYNGAYGSITVPGMAGWNIALRAYGTRADGSATGGQTDDLLIYFQWSFDVGFVYSPLSSFRGANDSVIYTAGQLKDLG